MELIFLGTSHGAAEADRFCSSVCLKVADTVYLFDCGAPVERLLKEHGIRPADIKATFITHMHEDHAGTLSSITKIFTVYEKNAETKIFFPEEGAIEAYRAWTSAMHMNDYGGTTDSRIGFHVIQNGEIYKDEQIDVTAIRTDHIKGYPSYAFTVNARGKKILITGDLATDFHDYPEAAAKEVFDVIVCELAHFSVEHAYPKLVQSKAKQLIFTHVYPGNEKNVAEVTFPYPVSVAVDGAVYHIGETD